MDAFDAQNPTLTVHALVRRADFPRATTYRLLENLMSHELQAPRTTIFRTLDNPAGSWRSVQRSFSSAA